jgi:hypothetical protein
VRLAVFLIAVCPSEQLTGKMEGAIIWVGTLAVRKYGQRTQWIGTSRWMAGSKRVSCATAPPAGAAAQASCSAAACVRWFFMAILTQKWHLKHVCPGFKKFLGLTLAAPSVLGCRVSWNCTSLSFYQCIETQSFCIFSNEKKKRFGSLIESCLALKETSRIEL